MKDGILGWVTHTFYIKGAFKKGGKGIGIQHEPEYRLIGGKVRSRSPSH